MTVTRPTIFLHIGAMKSGTTFLQNLMEANRAHLHEAGVLFPGETWSDQSLATKDVLRDRSSMSPALRSATRGKWEMLAREMLGHHGTSVFSMEFLSFANRARAGRVIESLAEADVHVVLGVRDAQRAIPAQWQTLCRNKGTIGWPQFVRATEHVVREGQVGGPAARAFRRTQGIPRMLEAWGAQVPPERLHVLTVPPSGSDPFLLWRRFAAVVGIDPEVARNPPPHVNTSIGQASAELMRRVNLQLERRGAMDHSLYSRVMKLHVAQALSRRSSEGRATLDRATLETALEWNRQVREAILTSGAHVVGDLDELPVTLPPAVMAAAPAALTTAAAPDILAAATTARDGLVHVIQAYSRSLAQLPEPPGLDVPVDLAGVPTTPDRWGGQQRPVRAAVGELADLAVCAMGLRRQVVALLPRPQE